MDKYVYLGPDGYLNLRPHKVYVPLLKKDVVGYCGPRILDELEHEGYLQYCQPYGEGSSVRYYKWFYPFIHFPDIVKLENSDPILNKKYWYFNSKVSPKDLNLNELQVYSFEYFAYRNKKEDEETWIILGDFKSIDGDIITIVNPKNGRYEDFIF